MEKKVKHVYRIEAKDIVEKFGLEGTVDNIEMDWDDDSDDSFVEITMIPKSDTTSNG